MQLCKCVQYAYRSKNLPRLTCIDSVQFQKKIPKISQCGSRSPNYKELGHFTLCFAQDGKEMFQDSKRTCTATVLLIKPFVWCRYRRRRRLLKLPVVLRGLLVRKSKEYTLFQNGLHLSILLFSWMRPFWNKVYVIQTFEEGGRLGPITRPCTKRFWTPACLSQV